MKLSYLLVVLTVVGLCGLAEATLELDGSYFENPVEDAAVDSQYSWLNYGDENVLAIQGTDDGMFGLPSKKESYLKFDLSEIPDNAVITSAVFGVYLLATSDEGGMVPSHASLHYVADDSWAEMDITWSGSSAKPDYNPGYIDEEFEMADIGYYEWDLLFSNAGEFTWSNYADDLAADVVSLMLKVSTNDENENNFTDYGSSEADEGVRPYLKITYVPEPLTIALLGLGGLFLRRRR